jgi:opacity protein-like surface antigen
MHWNTRIFLAFGILVLFSLPLFAQDSHSEISGNFTGDFPSEASGRGLRDKPTDSGGVLLNYRYGFNTWSALEVNYDYTSFSQFYGPSGFTRASYVTRADVNEATMAYVFTPGKSAGSRYRPFAEAGGGALFFSPTSRGSTVAGFTQDRPTFLYGAGIDWNAANNVSVRLGYRGLVYRASDFAVPVQRTDAMANLAEPYVGVVLRF